MPAYPIAKDAHDALRQLKAGATERASREREAGAIAGAGVVFVTESVGSLYERREDAVKAHGAVTDDPAVTLVARVKSTSRRRKAAVQPVFKDGERWPTTEAPDRAAWQLSVSYWKVLDAQRVRVAPSQKSARALKRKGGHTLTPEEVLALADSPLAPLRPQKGLDFGLFDFALPENPGIVIADE